MKPIHLNLAARPHRDYRPYVAAVVMGSLLIAYLTVTNFDTWYRYRNETQTTRAKIDSLDAQTVEEQRRADEVSQRLRAVDVKTLATQTQFANARIAERAFSWSELLDRLERVFAKDVRINSITPTFSKSGLVHLTLMCEAKTGDGLVTTLDRFNRDGHFANAFPANEEHTEVGYRFNLGVDYRPSIARPVE